MKKCIRCLVEKPVNEFYFKTKDKYPSYYTECKVCMNTRNMARLARLKIQAIDYKGGKCQRCGAQGHPKIFDFHHRDPSQKDFSISQVKSRSFSSIQNELDKCDLLCAICHRLIHHEQDFTSGTINVELFEELLIEWLPVKVRQESLCSCGVRISKQSLSCNICAHKAQERISWPSDEELAKLVWEQPRIQLAKKLGVSDVTITKRCKKRGIALPPVGYWN